VRRKTQGVLGWYLPLCATHQQMYTDTPINDLTRPCLPPFIPFKCDHFLCSLGCGSLFTALPS
jgi:hypothetical protein